MYQKLTHKKVTIEDEFKRQVQKVELLAQTISGSNPTFELEP